MVLILPFLERLQQEKHEEKGRGEESKVDLTLHLILFDTQTLENIRRV